MIDKDAKKVLKAVYESACASYAHALCDNWGLSQSDTWWVGDTPCSSTFCFGDIYALSIEELIYVIENDVTLETFLEYTDYNITCMEFNFNTMNLKSYCEGAPRVPQETFDELHKLKQNLDDAIREAKQRTAKKPF